MVGGRPVHRGSRGVRPMQKEKRLMWISHCGLQLGSGEFLVIRMRIVAGSYDFTAWISECGQMCTVCVRFVHITGFPQQIFKLIGNGIHFCTLKWKYTAERIKDIYNYMYREREREACHKRESMLEHTMIVERADNYHVIAIGHVKVSVIPLPVLVVLRPLQLHLVLQ